MRQMCQNETLCRHILHVTILHSTTVVPFSSLWQRELKCFFLLLLFTFSLSSVNWERDPCTFDTHTHTHTQTFIKSLGCMLFASRKYGCDHAGIAKSCTHLRGCPLDSYQCVLHSQCYNKNCCHVWRREAVTVSFKGGPGCPLSRDYCTVISSEAVGFIITPSLTGQHKWIKKNECFISTWKRNDRIQGG